MRAISHHALSQSEGTANALLSEGVELSGGTVRSTVAHGARLDPALARQGVLFGSLDQLVCEHGDLLRPYLFAAVDYHADKFAALHAACWSGGMVLYVPKGVVIERPLHMLSALSPGGVDLGHALIVLEEGAEATVLAETASLDAAAAGLHCGAIEIHVGPRAKLRYVNLQNWGSGVWHFAHQRALVGQDAALQWTIGALGSRLAKVNQHVALVGPGANVGSQRRDVHRGQAAPLVPHAATPQGAALHQRFALQGGAAGQVAAGVARHDQGRPRRPEDRRLPARRQPDSLRRRPGRLDSRAWRSRPTT